MLKAKKKCDIVKKKKKILIRYESQGVVLVKLYGLNPVESKCLK